jgi:D-beta-D-heptose 7-phosphate kinase/D-beta-D-heptose 1-phosphate adenosyltransferase
MTADAAAPSLAALQSIAARLADRPIVVVGDVMLDQFTHGRVQRISPEPPVPVVEHIGDEVRLGGAANVAHNIRALGATPRLVGLVGADDAAAALRGALDAAGIAGDGLVTDAARPTTRKVRIVTTRHQQVARVDYESDAEASGAVEAALLAAIDRLAADAAVIVVSDYLKGAVTPGLMAGLAERRARTGVAVLVDPKIPHLAAYAGATLITPNHHEAEVATHTRIRSDADARDAARAFRAAARATSVMITRGEHGLWLAEGAPAAAGQPVHETPLVVETNLPARAREVADVTGAGDTVIATLAVALASGATLLQAAELIDALS